MAGDVYHTSGALTIKGGSYAIGTGTTLTTVKTTGDVAVEFGTGDLTVRAGGLTVDAGDANITFGGNILGHADGDPAPITLDAGTATLTVLGIGHDGSNTNAEINLVDLTGGTISTNGTIFTTGITSGNAGNVELSGATSLTGNTTINTSSDGGSVTFNGDGGIDGAKTLTVLSGTGNISITGKIGDTTALTGVALNATGNGNGDITIAQIGKDNLTSGVTGTVSIGNTATDLVDFDGRYFSMDGDLTVTAEAAGTENIKFTGTGATTVKTANDAIVFSTADLQLAQNLTINSTGGAITIGNVYSTGGTRTLTINADATANGSDNDATETVTIGAIGTSDEIGAVLIDAHDGITLTGNITLADAAGADLDLDGKVFISGDVVIDTDNTTHDGLIDFESTIDGVSGDSADDDLEIKAGDNDTTAATNPGGVLTLGGAIGDTVALTTLKINATAGDIVLDIPQIGGGNPSVAGVTGQVDIGNSNTTRIDVNGNLDFGTGNVTFIAGSGGTAFTTANPTVDMVQTVTNGDGAADGGNFKITGAVSIANGTLDINLSLIHI